jgi:hypothetical protein
MNWAEVVAGVLLIASPFVARHQFSAIHDKLVARGEDPARFDRAMARPVMQVVVWGSGVLGVAVLIAGLIG